MARDNDKNNGRRDRPSGAKGRSGAARGPEKKFAKRGFAGNSEGDKRPYTPRGDRPKYNRDDRAPQGERGDARPAARFQQKKFGDKRPYAPRDDRGEKRSYTPRGEGFRKDGDRPRGDRPYNARPPRDGDRAQGERKFGGDKKFSRAGNRDERGPRKEFGSARDRGPARGESKPWHKRDAGSPDHAGRNSRASRDGAKSFEKRSYDKPRYDKPREHRAGEERPRFSRPREDRPQAHRPEGERPHRERPKFERPRRDGNSERGARRNDWQEHPRSEPRSFDRNADRPRRENEDDSKIFAKRPAFGGRGAYRERASEERRPARPPREKKSGERIAKVVSRAGLASRRDAEEWIVQGRVTVNGRLINSPALDVTENDVITVDGKPLPPRERTRLFLYHKPRGLMTTHADPEGRPTVFDN
ncbi:MAG: S4 domain-containing protein, partial [Bradyrhizobium sp.]